MTKLTKEQIEQERVEFEKIFNGLFSLHKNKYCEYLSDLARWSYRAWLARAELDKGEL